MATLGAVGFTTNLDPSMTLATGGIGGGVFSENISVKHVLNIKRLAWGVRRHPSGDRQHPTAEIDADDPGATQWPQMPESCAGPAAHIQRRR